MVPVQKLSIDYLRLLKPLFVAICVSCMGASACVRAAQEQTIGQISIVYKHFTYGGSSFTADGGVTVKSAHFNLNADSVVLELGDKTSTTGILKATAEGNPAKNLQVDGQFERGVEKQKQTFEFLADHAVYTPDPSRPSGGTVVFTGHVTMFVTAPDKLSGPSETHLKEATVTLGPSTDPAYPSIEGEDGQTVLTPLQRESK